MNHLHPWAGASVRRIWAFMLLAVLASAAQAAPETAATAARFPVYRNGAEVGRACDAALKQAMAARKRLESAAVPPQRLLAAIDDLFIAADDVMNPIDVLVNAHPQKDIREAGEACTVKYQQFRTDFSQSQAIYAKLRQLRPKDEVDALLRQDLIEGFEDSGVGLPKAKRERARELSDLMTKASLEFERNVREDKTTVAFTAEELQGVPESVWKDRKRDEQGRYILSIDNPTYEPVMQAADNPATRERMYRAKLGEGGAGNIQVLGRLAAMRKEYAGLFGYATYADFVLRRKMAQNAARVSAFLDSVSNAVRERERADIDELRQAKAQQAGAAALPPLERWDVAYYTERVKRAKYAIDQEQFRQYFPPEASLKFVFRLAEKLFAVRFEPVQRELWHPDVRAWQVFDVATNRYLATFYADMYPRADKYNHYAVWSFRDSSTRTGRRAAAAMIGNFDRKGLTIEELETLLHEFGHGMHSMLSQARYAQQSGTNVLQDFVEAPSQMLEEWVYQPEVLALFQEVCPQCKPVPPELIRQVNASRSFGKGIRYARQHLYASYDLALHGATLRDPLELWAEMEGATPLGYVKGTMLPASFGHLASGYAAGYYGYLWSEVIAKDLQAAFAGHMLDPALGARYRQAVLENGGQRKPDALLRQFLGRDSNGTAFFNYLKQ